MANVERINKEITRVKAKITDYQARLRELEKQKTDAENSKIIGLVRGGMISADELDAMIKAFAADKGGALDSAVKNNTSKTEMEEQSDEE